MDDPNLLLPELHRRRHFKHPRGTAFETGILNMLSWALWHSRKTVVLELINLEKSVSGISNLVCLAKEETSGIH